MNGSIRAAARRWRDERGLEMVETVAVIGVCIALLVATMAVFSANGGNIGGAAVGRLGTFITQGQVASGQNPMSPSQFQPNLAQAQPMQQALQVVAMGVPGVVSAQVQPVPAQASNFIVTWWNSLPIGVQGALIAAAAAVVVGIIFVALVALGVLTFVSLPVAAVIAVVGVVLAAIAGAIYAIWTGKVDVLQLLLLGAAVQLVVIGVAWAVASGTAAAAVAWISRTAWPWVMRTVGGLVRGAGRLAMRFFGWVRNTAAPWVTRAIGGLLRGAGRLATGIFRVVSWPFRMVGRGWKWLAKNLDNKLVPFKFLKWEIKPSDVISNIIKLFVYAAVFKEIWVSGGNMAWWQWLLFAVFAVVSAYLPGGGIARVLMKALYDFLSVWITGGIKFFESVWKKLFGSNPPTPKPTPSGTPTTPTPPPTQPSPTP